MQHASPHGLELGERLGSGAFGAVFAAHDEEHGDVAVKVLEDVPDAAALQRAFEELRAVSHPNLVRLLDLRMSGGTAFLLMERVRGTDLLTAIRGPKRAVDPALVRQGPGLLLGQSVQDPGVSAFAPIEASAVPRLRAAMAQLAAALSALHAAGKAHRDVRPENVLVDGDHVVLVDLGLVAEIGARGEADDIAGSPAYMAPDDEPSAPGDLYAMGVLLFEALTGALPFSGTAHEVVVRKRTVSAPSPGFVVPLPPEAADLDQLCVKLLRRVASLRPRADEVLAALGA